MTKKLGMGWHFESNRHSLAAKGIKSGSRTSVPIQYPQKKKLQNLDSETDLLLLMEFRQTYEDDWNDYLKSIKVTRKQADMDAENGDKEDDMRLMDFRGVEWTKWKKFAEKNGYKPEVND